MASPGSSSSISTMLSSTINGGNSTIAQEVRERLAQAAREVALQRGKLALPPTSTSSGPISTDLATTSSNPLQSRTVLSGSQAVDRQKPVEKQSSDGRINEQTRIPSGISGSVPLSAEKKVAQLGKSEATPVEESSSAVERREDKDGYLTAAAIGPTSIAISTVIQRPPVTSAQKPATSQSNKKSPNPKVLGAVFSSFTPSPESDQSSLTALSSEGDKDLVASPVASNSHNQSIADGEEMVSTALVESVPEEEGDNHDAFDEQATVGEFTLDLALIPRRILRQIGSMEASLFKVRGQNGLNLGTQGFVASAEPHVGRPDHPGASVSNEFEFTAANVVSAPNTSAVSDASTKKKRGRPPKTASAADRSSNASKSSQKGLEDEHDQLFEPTEQATVSQPQKKTARVMALGEKTSAKEAETRKRQMEQMDAKKKPKHVTIAEPSETSSPDRIKSFQTARLARRTARTSGVAVIVPNTKIGESEVKQLMNRVANAVQMIQEILWPQYSTLESPRPEPSAELASSYWNAVTLVLRKQQGESEMLARMERAMRDLVERKATHAEVMFDVAFALAGNDKLLMGFDIFLPSELSMTQLLVFQKLSVALVQIFDPSAVTDKKRQRDMIRKAMDDLLDALEDDFSSTSALLKSKQPQVLEAKKDSAVTTTVSSGTESSLIQARNWLELLLKRYGGTVEGSVQCAPVLKAIAALAEPNGTEYGKKKLVDFIRGVVKSDPELRTSFDAFAHTLF